MDVSDWIGLGYITVGLILFPFCVRFMWRAELDRETGIPSLGMAGFFAFCLCLLWPFVVIYWIIMGLLELITIGIKEY